MFILVVTGGLGAGKSTASRYFASRGAVVLDLDEIAHRLLEPGSATHARVVEAFGEAILDGHGRVDRARLAAAAFASREAADLLNSIMHPAVFREIGPGLTQIGLLPSPPAVVVLEIPLLVEAPDFLEFADLAVAVVAPEEMRVGRKVAEGMSEGDARARIAVQASDEQRIRIADHVLINASDPSTFRTELEAFWERVIGR